MTHRPLQALAALALRDDIPDDVRSRAEALVHSWSFAVLANAGDDLPQPGSGFVAALRAGAAASSRGADDAGFYARGGVLSPSFRSQRGPARGFGVSAVTNTSRAARSNGSGGDLRASR